MPATSTHLHAATTRGRALRLLVAMALLLAVPVVVVGALLGALAGSIVGFTIGGVLLGAGLAASVVVPGSQAAEGRVLDRVGARPADPFAQARLFNLVEGLCTGAGLPRPRLFTLESEALNAMGLGRDARHGCLVVTDGVLSTLNRIELEGVLAHLLCRLRDGVTTAPTIALSLAGGPFGSLVAGRVQTTVPLDALTIVDQAAVALTRYPPALLSALEKIRDANRAATGAPEAVASPLWISPLAPAHGAGSLEERIEALREL